MTRRSQRSRDDQLQRTASDNACYCALQQTASSKQLIFCQGDSESASIYGRSWRGLGRGRKPLPGLLEWKRSPRWTACTQWVAGRGTQCDQCDAHGRGKKNKTRVTAHSASLWRVGKTSLAGVKRGGRAFAHNNGASHRKNSHSASELGRPKWPQLLANGPAGSPRPRGTVESSLIMPKRVLSFGFRTSLWS